MNREIKFRAWDGDTLRDCEEIIRNGWSPLTTKEYNGNKIIWMQFTGLKDKNGKEIYEGDLLHIVIDDDECVREIKYYGDKEYPAFDVDEIPWLGNESNYLSSISNLGTMEIIGNIYENPELLKP